MGVNVPSAKGVEWKSRDVAAARRAFDVNYERVFGHKAANYEGRPAPSGPALTNDLCGQNVKVKTNMDKRETEGVNDGDVSEI